MAGSQVTTLELRPCLSARIAIAPHRVEGPGTPEESGKSTPGQGPESAERVRPRVSKESEKSPKVMFSDSFETPGRTLSALSGPCPGVLFLDFFRALPGFRAQRARETPVCGVGPIAMLELESQRPATGLRTPKSPKVPGRVLGRVPGKKGLLGGLLGAVPFLCFSKETGLPALLPAVPPAVPFFPALFPALSPALLGIWAISVL